jgi:hypothetical protein
MIEEEKMNVTRPTTAMIHAMLDKTAALRYPNNWRVAEVPLDAFLKHGIQLAPNNELSGSLPAIMFQLTHTLKEFLPEEVLALKSRVAHMLSFANARNIPAILEETFKLVPEMDSDLVALLKNTAKIKMRPSK